MVVIYRLSIGAALWLLTKLRPHKTDFPTRICSKLFPHISAAEKAKGQKIIHVTYNMTHQLSTKCRTLRSPSNKAHNINITKQPP